MIVSSVVYQIALFSSYNGPHDSEQYKALAIMTLNPLQVQVNKENLMEFLLDILYYLYNYYMVCALISHTYHVILSHITFLYSKSK